MFVSPTLGRRRNLVGRTPWSARGPPDPHAASPQQEVRLHRRRRMGGLHDSSAGFDHRGCKWLIQRRLGGFRHTAVSCSSTVLRCSILLHHLSD